MSQPPTPEPVPSDGDRRRAAAFAAVAGLSPVQATVLAREFAEARGEELGWEERDLPLEPLPLEAQQAVQLIRRVTATLREPGELEMAPLPMGERGEPILVTSIHELTQWLDGLATRVLYGGLDQLAEAE